MLIVALPPLMFLATGILALRFRNAIAKRQFPQSALLGGATARIEGITMTLTIGGVGLLFWQVPASLASVLVSYSYIVAYAPGVRSSASFQTLQVWQQSVCFILEFLVGLILILRARPIAHWIDRRMREK